jgi:hypothetical protein
MRKLFMCALLGLLASGAANRAHASIVEYPEASYTIPDYMTEVPADDVHGYGPNPQGRSFLSRDADGHIALSVTSYRDTSQIADEKAWAAVASAPEEQLIQAIQASFAGGPAANKASVEHVVADRAAHKLISVATVQDSGTVWKLVTAVLALKDHQSLHLEVYVDQRRFKDLTPEIKRIIESLSATPEFQLR